MRAEKYNEYEDISDQVHCAEITNERLRSNCYSVLAKQLSNNMFDELSYALNNNNNKNEIQIIECPGYIKKEEMKLFTVIGALRWSWYTIPAHSCKCGEKRSSKWLQDRCVGMAFGYLQNSALLLVYVSVLLPLKWKTQMQRK